MKEGFDFMHQLLVFIKENRELIEVATGVIATAYMIWTTKMAIRGDGAVKALNATTTAIEVAEPTPDTRNVKSEVSARRGLLPPRANRILEESIEIARSLREKGKGETK